MAAGVEADAADAVVNGRVVAVGPVHLQGVAVGDAGGMVVAGLFHADPKWIGGIEIQDTMILDIDLRHAVIGGRQQKL